MALKVYKASLRLTVPLVENGKVLKYVSFQDENHTFSTADEKVQKALEALSLFSRSFKLIRTVDEKKKTDVALPPPDRKDTNEGAGDPVKSGSGEEYTVYEDVTDWQAAKDVLRGEPFNVPYQGLNNPDLILKKAEELRVSFPNLNLN